MIPQILTICLLSAIVLKLSGHDFAEITQKFVEVYEKFFIKISNQFENDSNLNE